MSTALILLHVTLAFLQQPFPHPQAPDSALRALTRSSDKYDMQIISPLRQSLCRW